MKHLLLLFLLPLFLTVSAQDTLSVGFVDTPPQLKSEDIPRAEGISDQNDLFLCGVYNSLRYPAYARQYGVPTIVGVTYLVDINGEISIEKTSAFSPGGATKLDAPKGELVTITAFPAISEIRGPGTPVAPPRQAKRENRLVKAHAALEEAAAASILELPKFLPGSHEGKPVVVRSTRFFSFRML